MLSEIVLRSGSESSRQELRVPLTSIVVVVGPNGSGKSLLLRELEDIFTLPHMRQNPKPRVLVDDVSIDCDWNSILSDARDLLHTSPVRHLPGHDRILDVTKIDPMRGVQSSRIHMEAVENAARGEPNAVQQIKGSFLWRYVIRLDGRTRFNLVASRPVDDLQGRPTSHLSFIFRDSRIRHNISRLVYEAFRLYFVIDPTSIQQFRIRLSARVPVTEEEEQSLSAASREFHHAATPIEDSSDGVQAYTGILCALSAGAYKLFLIDEPEAFLHPPLARRLGREVARLAAVGKNRLIAATHSPEFLLGCVESGLPVTVIRMNYKNGFARPRLVDSAQLARFLRHPLFRSANVVSGLFHDGVVVTESDNDRVFYSEIYNRIRSIDHNLPDILFLNAQNKQTAREIFGPLRAFGVPAAAIFDIDLIKEGFAETLQAANVPEPSRNPLSQWRAVIKGAFTSLDLDMKRANALDVLPKEAQGAANDLFDQLDQYGIFVVRRGELEGWLPSVGITSKKTAWTVNILDRLGISKGVDGYVATESNDVWQFIQTIATWLGNPERKGMG